MKAPDMTILYVRDVAASARFYADLFDLAPDLETPRFTSFTLPGGHHLALWSGYEGRPAPVADEGTPTSELGVALPGAPQSVDEAHADWAARGLEIVEAPHDAPFGRTFVARDRDGNRLRVAPVD